jgi:DNA-binding GntR family transcriptional regulator
MQNIVFWIQYAIHKSTKRCKGSKMTKAELFNEMEYPSLPDRIYQLLKDSIARHELEPGTRLIDQEIAGNLGVSRTPVREALSKLEVEGLVTIVPRRGVFVADPSPQDIKDTYEVREALEALAVELAVPLLREEDLAGLEKMMEDFKVALDDQEYLVCFELDRKFHDQLVKLSGNNKLIEIDRLLDGNIQVTRWIHCRDQQRQELAYREHRMILDALVKKDADLASRLVREHIRRVERDLLAGQQENV